MSENKTTKYLAYAFGEILLVVIGILIALGINNANTNRQDRNKLHGYLDKISQNVSADLLALKELSDLREATSRSSEIVLSRISRSNYALDATSIAGLQNVFVQRYFSANRGAYESLINSGYLEQLKSETIQELLLAYYKTIKDLEKEEEIFNRFLEAMETELAKEGMMKALFPLERADLAAEISPQELEARLKTFFEHPATFTMLSSYTRIQGLREYYQQIDSLGNQMITEIETEINL